MLIKVKVLGGTTIDEMADEVIELATKLNCVVSTSFNGCVFIVTNKSSAERIREVYNDYCKVNYPN